MKANVAYVHGNFLTVPKEDVCKLRCVSISDVKFSGGSAEAAEGTLCNNRTNNRCLFGKCHVSPVNHFVV